MEKYALLGRLEAKPGKENEVAAFIKSALPIAIGEQETVKWYGWQIGPSTFGIFDTFESEEGRQAHLAGQIAADLTKHAGDLLSQDPVIEFLDLLAVK